MAICNLPADKDGLIFSRNLIIISPNENQAEFSFRLRGKDSDTLYYPKPEIRKVIDFLVSDAKLWNIARIRVIQKNLGQKRVPIFGPDFETAIRAAIRTKIVKSRFSLIKPESFSEMGPTADLIVNVNRFVNQFNKRAFEIQVWVCLRNEPEVFYIHAHLNAGLDFFTHLDGARIFLSPENLKNLIYHGRRVKGQEYQKQFRIDSAGLEISSSDGFNVIRSYLPVTELLDEYFQEQIIR